MAEMEPSDFAVLLLRVWLGVVMLAHGYNHSRDLKGAASYLASKGFRRERLLARLSTVGEGAIGLGLVVGLLTSVAVAGLVATMTLAYGSVHRFAGFFVFKRPDEGWEYVATLSVAAIALAMIGPGSLSLDAAFGFDLEGWVGLLIALGGVVLGAVQLAALWRKPE